MSLFALPVSVSDLTKLQLGIEFFTNTTEATAEAGLITNPPSTPTVYTYAVQLLANNLSLSQVAMAVDLLMFGVTDNVAELTKLATQFLPAQVANAVTHGFNPTVYAAEALGLALAGGNGTSNAFATNVGSLSVSDFALAVASLTGVNSGGDPRICEQLDQLLHRKPACWRPAGDARGLRRSLRRRGWCRVG